MMRFIEGKPLRAPPSGTFLNDVKTGQFIYHKTGQFYLLLTGKERIFLFEAAPAFLSNFFLIFMFNSPVVCLGHCSPVSFRVKGEILVSNTVKDLKGFSWASQRPPDRVLRSEISGSN